MQVKTVSFQMNYKVYQKEIRKPRIVCMSSNIKT